MNNPVSQYMAENEIGTVEMANRLGVSKGYVSRVKDGEKPITPRIAKRLSALTGEPWWTFMPEDVPQ
jgi:transcriptional regulator with XRE-family HTH domain